MIQNISEEAQEIIAAIAGIQMNALESIIHNTSSNEYNNFLKLLQIPDKDIYSAAKDLHNFYQRVQERPILITMANEYQVLVCHHILWVMEDEWINNNPKGVADTWRIFAEIIDGFHPEFAQIALV